MISFIYFLSSRVLGLRRTPSHMAPFGGEGPLTHLCDLEAGYGGVWAPNFLVGRHRDLNPRPPACKSGVVAITLRGPPRNFLYNIDKNYSEFFPAQFLKTEPPPPASPKERAGPPGQAACPSGGKLRRVQVSLDMLSSELLLIHGVLFRSLSSPRHFQTITSLQRLL